MSNPRKKKAPAARAAEARNNNTKHKNSMPPGACKAVPTAWWLMADFLALPANERALLLMLWTAPTTPLCGIVEVSCEGWAARLGITARSVRSAVGGLFHAGFVDVEQGEPLLVLREHIEAQLRSHEWTANRIWRTNTLNALDRMPECAVVARFRDRYGLPKRASETRGSGRGNGGGSGRGSGRGAPVRILCAATAARCDSALGAGSALFFGALEAGDA